MQVLTKETLDSAVKKCQDNKCYKVIIATEYSTTNDDIINYLSQFECERVCRFNNPYVYFTNGSSIRMLSLANTPRGYRADLVLCVSNIYYDDKSIKFKAMEVNNRVFRGLKDEV